jgi:hypothetical protein
MEHFASLSCRLRNINYPCSATLWSDASYTLALLTCHLFLNLHPQGKERYVFFSFPHIAIDSDGKVGAISRPNRPGASAACGALIKTMLDLKAEGVDDVVGPGSHDPLEPEYSILKSRVARRIKYEKMDPASMDLVDFTKIAERVITTVRVQSI